MDFDMKDSGGLSGGDPSSDAIQQCNRNGIRNRFLILTRELAPAAESLGSILERFGKVEVVVDREGGSVPVVEAARTIVCLPDDELFGYEGLMGRYDLPRITAWSKAFAHMAMTLNDDEVVWFVEDDVAGDAESFARLIRFTASKNVDLAAPELRTEEEDPGWYWWGRAEGKFSLPCRGFQPICRLSARLVRAVLGFREKHGGFLFHELLFASLAKERGMTWLDWGRTPELGHLFAHFRYRPEVVSVSHGLSHPVKDPEIHRTICSLPPAEFPRLMRARCEGWSVLREDYVFLARFCGMFGIDQVVEFGPGDSTLAFLDAGCRVVSFEHDRGWLAHVEARLEDESDITVRHCPEGSVPPTEDLGFSPQLVFVDGPPLREGQKLSRLQPCEWALEVCGCFLLHDAGREAEQATLAHMKQRGMSVTRIPTRKGLALVIDPDRRPEMLKEIKMTPTAQYKGNSGWHDDSALAWSVLFRDNTKPARVLEIGAGEGAGANLMLDLLYAHPESEAHCIDHYDGAEGDRMRRVFEENAELSGRSNSLLLYEGISREILAWMIVEEGYWQSFDLIHLAGRKEASELLADACQSWDLLKPGGILIFGAGGHEGRDAFVNTYGDRLVRILEGARLVVSKRR